MPSSDLAPLPEGLDPALLRITQVRGPMTRQVREAVLREGGESAWNTLLEQVSPECRAAFSSEIGLYQWVESNHSVELSLAYLAQGHSRFTRERSEEAAREMLTTLNRWLLRMLSPVFVVNALPRLFGFYYRGGKATVDALEEGFALCSLWADGMYPEWFEEGIPASFKAGLEATGAREVTVVHRPPQGRGLQAFRHQYEVRWK